LSAVNIPQAPLAEKRRLAARRIARPRLGSGSLTAGLILLGGMLVFSIVATLASPSPTA